MSRARSWSARPEPVGEGPRADRTQLSTFGVRSARPDPDQDVMTFDVRRYEDDVLKPLRRPGSDLDDLPLLYALRGPGTGSTIPADPEVLAVRIRQVRELWRQRSAGVRATDRICRELLRRDELLRAGTGPRLEDPGVWREDRWKVFLHREPPRPPAAQFPPPGPAEPRDADRAQAGDRDPAGPAVPPRPVPVAPAARISMPSRLLPLPEPREDPVAEAAPPGNGPGRVGGAGGDRDPTGDGAGPDPSGAGPREDPGENRGTDVRGPADPEDPDGPQAGPAGHDPRPDAGACAPSGPADPGNGPGAVGADPGGLPVGPARQNWRERLRRGAGGIWPSRVQPAPPPEEPPATGHGAGSPGEHLPDPDGVARGPARDAARDDGEDRDPQDPRTALPTPGATAEEPLLPTVPEDLTGPLVPEDDLPPRFPFEPPGTTSGSPDPGDGTRHRGSARDGIPVPAWLEPVRPSGPPAAGGPAGGEPQRSCEPQEPGDPPGSAGPGPGAEGTGPPGPVESPEPAGFPQPSGSPEPAEFPDSPGPARTPEPESGPCSPEPQPGPRPAEQEFRTLSPDSGSWFSPQDDVPPSPRSDRWFSPQRPAPVSREPVDEPGRTDPGPAGPELTGPEPVGPGSTGPESEGQELVEPEPTGQESTGPWPGGPGPAREPAPPADAVATVSEDPVPEPEFLHRPEHPEEPSTGLPRTPHPDLPGPDEADPADPLGPDVVVEETGLLRGLAAATTSEQVRVTWRPAPGIELVRVLRTRGRPEDADGPGMPLGETPDGFVDGDVEFGQWYTYTLVPLLRAGDGPTVQSRPIRLSARPWYEARAVTDLRAELLPTGSGPEPSDARVRLEWTAQARGGSLVRILRGTDPVPWAEGQIVTEGALAEYGELLNGRREMSVRRERLVADVPAEPSVFLPVAVGSGGVIVGRPVELGIVPGVSELRARRMAGRVVLSWAWPPEAASVQVRWSQGENNGTEFVSRTDYRRQGGCPVRAGRDEVRFEVLTQNTSRFGQALSSPVVLALPAQGTELEYNIVRPPRPGGEAGPGRARGPGAWGRWAMRRTVRGAHAVVVRAPAGACGLHLVVVVSATGAMPLRPEHGTRIAQVEDLDLEPGQVHLIHLEVPPEVARPYWLRCFVLSPSGAGIVDPPVAELRFTR